ncbi:Putative multidrug export ATP-binding/permease protein SAV1866 [Aggregatibacter actinomycetemcomitans]|uniref:ABC transporter ATP-binding protein n=1 Tax=Aggregatibacter actinomycetemcomitans TaxID=714 RepID=UPI0001B9F7EB|nr:ABC transporter ATP-binding protein [Aggregatibacter actinomycetemcomitans]ACX81795.1 multidrug ABC transporter ATP-binding protein [Aggregatibacter actinomycetemcomitans D11S-1]KOE59173.1 multidrug ABC transporter ATP-binding protein [Aggregatibacter actinomycetemcomitans serotype c str. D17P-2]KYK74220.1 multidrug ABC transporter ATP-binding protein [Aggregatibacter actinomycetemcomitans serotype e str. SA2149]KYK78061.1 multidrug ABC transporter ATP-binding protein [Aggregatibacter actino
MFEKIFSWFENRLNPYPDQAPKTPEKGLFHFIWSGIDGMKRWILLLAILTIGGGIMEALLFQFMGLLVDWLTAYTPATLWQEKGDLLMGMAGLLILSILLLFLATAVRLQTLQGVFPMRLRWNFHRLMLGQSLSFYQDEFAGRVSAKVMQTALAVRDTVLTIADVLVYVVVYFVTSGLVLASLDSWFLLPFIVWIVLFVTILRLLIPRLAKTAERQADARSLMTGRITDAYSNIATVKLFSHGSREAGYAKRSMEEFMVTVHDQMRLATSLDTLTYITNVMLILSTAVIGVLLWQQGLVGVGAIATATAMALRVHGLSRWIMWESARLFENIGTVNDGMNTLTKQQTILDKPNCPPLKVTYGEIKFDDVSFAYDPVKPLLTHFNLTIKPGEKVGLIGRSGAGKSTIVNLLLRFYEAQQGAITIDGQNIIDVQQESLRSQIGLVTQDTSLLHRSVRDNIVYGRPTATEQEMLDAAERAEAADFIPYLSDAQGRHGYDAHVGERGVKLSGGQRQRIAIARVMLKDAPILLLDEATSALDSEVEAAIQESLDKMMENKTVIAIAHRLSTIAAMDRLIVLDHGQIVEQGTHAELLAQNGLYAKLWQHQSGGFLSEHVD